MFHTVEIYVDEMVKTNGFHKEYQQSQIVNNKVDVTTKIK